MCTLPLFLFLIEAFTLSNSKTPFSCGQNPCYLYRLNKTSSKLCPQESQKAGNYWNFPEQFSCTCSK